MTSGGPAAVDADAVASAALSVPTVARLGKGTGVEVATYLPGRRVTGVRVAEDDVEVHVVARWGASLPELGDQVRTAVAPHAGGRRVEVHVEDIEVPGEEEPTAPLGELPPGSP